MLNLIPRWVLHYAVAALAILAGITTLQANFARTELANLKAEVATATQKAERGERTKEQDRQTQANRVANDDLKRQTTRQGSADSLDRATDSLRNTIAAANARAASEGANAAASAQEASTARDLLGQCSVEYSNVAKVTDQLSDQVTGLQDFINTATGISESE